MSKSASFWAAKYDDVKSKNAPADVAKPAAQYEPSKKGTMFLKSMPSPHPPHISTDKSRGGTDGSKKTSWADSDDEEEFLASFTSSGRMNELEKTVAAKDARITDILSLLQQKDARIADLESAIEKQSLRFSELEGTVDASIVQIKELEKDNHKRALHVQQLVADVDEKDRRIAVLESEIDEQYATIAELDSGNDSTQVSSHGTPKISKSTSADTNPQKDELKHDTKEPPQHTVQPKAGNPPVDNIGVTSPTKTTPTTATGPTVNLSAFPIFVTAATIKQTAPPPSAPKLKMAVDLSKFGKKSTTKSTTSKRDSNATPLDAKIDGPAPTIDSSSDIRTKSREERALFANGPKVQVKMGETALATVPKYVLMQCSTKAFKHFSEIPNASTFDLPADAMDAAAASAHLVWMKEMTHQSRVYSITLHSDEKFDDMNLQICRAARVLGLNNMYVGHFTKIFCDRIRSNAASEAFLSKVATVAYPENDPIYDCLANNLANSRLQDTVGNPAAMEALLLNNEGLKIKVEKIEDRMRKRQDSAKRTKGSKVVHVGKKMGF